MVLGGNGPHRKEGLGCCVYVEKKLKHGSPTPLIPCPFVMSSKPAFPRPLISLFNSSHGSEVAEAV